MQSVLSVSYICDKVREGGIERGRNIYIGRPLIKAIARSGPGSPAGGASGEFCHFWGGKFSVEIIDVARVIDELCPADQTATRIHAHTHTHTHSIGTCVCIRVCMCVCVPGYTTWEACVSYIGVVVPAENGVRRPPIGLPLAGPGVARCSHRFRQSLADSAPAAILNDSGINTRGAEKKCMQAHRRPRFPRPYLTIVLSPFARHRRSLSLSLMFSI